MRAFIAVEPSAEARGALAELADEMRAALGSRARALSFVRPASLHLTLKFLGETEVARVSRLAQALSPCLRDFAPFAVALEGAGFFPPRGGPRVAWAGVAEGAAQLGALAAAVDRAAVDLGFAPEERPYRAHLTLARVKDRRAGRAVVRALEPYAAARFGRFPVQRVVLFRSETLPDGALHSPVASFPLGTEALP